jgi:hypothetical protein
MKISINCSHKGGAFGGGAHFVKNLSDFLFLNKHEVFFDLKQKDLDIILIIDPRKIKSFTNYSTGQVARYLKSTNNKAIVVHRINECDERKNTNFMNKKLRVCNYLSDHTIVISNYLKTLDLFFDEKTPITKIINGANNKIFKPHKKKKSSYFSIVTHHWSPNFLKGHDIYQLLDRLCGSNKWKGKIKFTYIGNFPKNIKFVNSKIINPLSNIYLAKELQKHDIYLTASNNDPGPSHHIEGALCGLPLLYKNSGGITESAKGYGVRFESANDFENSLSNLIQNYEKYEKKMKLFPYTKDKMCKQYLDLFKKILINRNNYYISRKKKYNFWYNLFFLLKFW